ncbi:unnamed protein product [Paramecium primaurelia]|uniref:Protein kinase domain-containing protein n=1 Tax=Paramecium primaurelia TaxID=5886 RepID=A0A8S1NKJ3_PARPR|nr:unnamed protein product [Paramecium primaurelia]
MDLQNQRRKSKFSFSRAPVYDNTQQNTLQQFKNKFKGQMLQLINRSENGNNKQQEIQQFLSRISVELDEEDHKYIKFELSEYNEKYTEGEVLGEGCIGLVKSITRKIDGQELACKTVKTDAEEIVKNMILEFKNLKKLSHPRIVKMEELYIQWNEGFQSTGTVYVVMEKVKGSEMFEVIQKQKNYSECIARILFQQILEAIDYMHENYCCHRDLKPNNILCAEDGRSIKITDFNVSKFTDGYKEFGNLNEHGKIEMWTYTGTVAFSAPEIFSGGLYNEQVDLWSAGVILYVMLSGELPFNSDYLNDLIDKIQQCKYEMVGPIWDQISYQAKDLISNLLQFDPQKRLTPQQALEHPWVKNAQNESNLPRDRLEKNMARFLNWKPQETQMNAKKIKQLCFLFGAGEIWKRNSLKHSSVSTISEEFKKFKSIDITSFKATEHIQVIKDKNSSHIYHIDYPFSDDESD